MGDFLSRLPRLIFCLTTGRSGTAYLAALLDSMPGVHGVHEGKPAMVDVARAVRRDPREAWRYWHCEKLPHVASLDCDVYAETDHLFGKGFVKPLLDIGVVPDVIVLNRNPRDVALSFWRRGSVPGRTLRGQRYLLHPERAEYCALDNWWRYSSYQLCYWYVLEMNERIAERVGWIISAGGKALCLRFDTLIGKLDVADHIAGLLDLPAPSETPDDLPRNATPEQYKSIVPPGDLDEQEAEVEKAATEYKSLDPRVRIDIIVLSMEKLRKELSSTLMALSWDTHYNITVGFAAANPTSNNRCQISKEFLDNERRPHWLMMIDEDTCPNGNFLRWVESDYDVIAFATPVWKPATHPENPIVWNVQLDKDKEQFTPRLPKGEQIIDVASAGTGAILIKREVLEHPEMRWPFRDVFDEHGIRVTGHDLNFCTRARELGFKVASVLQNPASHYKSVDLLDVARLTGSLT